MTDNPIRMAQEAYDRRKLTCARCKKKTDNTSQGHYWKYCKVTKTMREFHFCCPDDCELEEKKDG